MIMLMFIRIQNDLRSSVDLLGEIKKLRKKMRLNAVKSFNRILIERR
jgi:hypothetical protein